MLNNSDNLSRRDLIKRIGLSASASLIAPMSFARTEETQSGSLRITSVRAFPVKMWKNFSGWKSMQFESNDDSRRWFYRGPYAQLTSSIVVIIQTKEGVTGYGLGAGGQVGVQIVEGHLRDLLIGTNALKVEMLWDQIYSSGLFYGRRGAFVMALSGIDNALWDIRGKQAGRPVHSLLGQKGKDRIPIYQTGRQTEVEIGLERGIQHFKVVVADGVRDGEPGKQRTEKILSEVRELIGPQKSLMAECTAKWNDVNYTLEMARRLEGCDLYWIEEPLSPDDLVGYEQLVAQIDSTRIASGEHEYTRYGFSELIRHRAADVFQPDVSWSGGLTSLINIEALAKNNALEFTPHRGGCLFGLPICLNSNQCNWAESFGDERYSTDLMMAMTPEVDNGFYLPSQKPGFGTALDETLIKKHVLV